MEALPQDLADFLVTRNFDPEYFDAAGQPSEAGDAKTMKFDYVSGSGKNYGTAVVIIADDELSLFYGDNLGRGMEPEDKDEWYSFLEELSNKAASHSATWSPRDINQLKHTLAGIAAIKEGLFEGYYGNRRVSYMGEQTEARLVIRHNRTLGQDDKRFRYVDSLFIETADKERFRLPFKSLAGGRAMLEHVRSGGRPYDIRGNHITEIVAEMAVLSRFNRAQQRRVFEGVTQELVESAREYYHNLQETVKHLGSTRGYQAYFETWAPDTVGEAEALVENLRNLFVEQTLDARIEDALPTLAKIQQQGMKMKEAEIFENWINNLSEGTWALPETPEQQEKLNKLMSAELIVGPDAINATEQLYDIVGDDELFDILNDLADRSEGRANCWDDSDVQRRLAELGIQTPQSTRAEPADVAQDEAPPVKEQGMAEALPSKRGGQRRLRDALEDDPDMMGYHAIAALYGNQMWDNDAMGDLVNDLEQANPTPEELQYIILNAELPARLKSIRFTNTDDVQFGHMDEGDNTATFVEDRELSRMLKYAGVPIREGVLRDDTGNTWDHIIDRFRHEVEQFKQGGDMSDDLYDALYDYYYDHGAMPYGVAKARTGDPYEWISNRLADDLGLDEGVLGTVGGAALGSMLGGPIGAAVGATGGQEMTKGGSSIIEGSCNMTAEGEYCPEHGLMECGSMEEGFLGKVFGTEKKKKAQGQLRPYMIYDKFTIYVDPVDGEWVVAGTGEYENKFEPKATPMYGQFGNPDLLVMYAMKHTGGGFGIRDPLKVNKEALRGVQEDGGAVGMPYSMGENNEIVQNAKKLTDGWKGTLAGSAAGGLAGSAAGEALGPAAGAALGGAVGGLPGALAGAASGAAAGGAIGGAAGGLAGGKIGDKLGGPEKTDEGSGTANMIKGAAKAATQGLADMSGSGKEIAKNLVYMEDDPINSNSAMTGSYYEGKETDIQEGDALLARIKSLALLR